MPVPSFQITCTARDVIARDVYEIRFGKPENFTFKEGQFVLFDVPLVDNPADIQTRALSIASTQGEEELLFGLKLKPGGRVSRWVAETLKIGMTVRIQGPFGVFVLDPASERERVFVATSAGVAPFRAHIKAALERGDQRKMDLIYGVRSEEDLFWHRELEELSKAYPNFFLHLALTIPSPTWKGHVGRVQTLVPLVIPDFSQKEVYVCGNPDMTTEVKKLCLEQWRVEKKYLHVEGYI
ncbi:MAG: FAD-dependent oxidoreductase [Candidatus Peregrinibacteria bacterium]|nr:FAD-dependent oxidoreductase [Candidatus Peregrinibacteria bacterium]